MSMYGKGLKPDSIHVLSNRGAELPFQWTGKSWSSPGTGYGTKPGGMIALGWVYKEQQLQPKGSEHD